MIREIQTLQYMGSKARILGPIYKEMERLDPDVVVDLFAGTCSVGYALKDLCEVSSNDIEEYAFVINEAVLNGCMCSEEDIDDYFMRVQSLFSKSQLRYRVPLGVEDAFMCGEISDWHAYKAYCETTPAVGYPARSDYDFSSLEENIEAICSGHIPSEACLFVSYYANTYFGLRQCCEIDALRSAAEEIKDARLKRVILTAIMSAMSSSASTTTHFAQYLKVNGKRSFRNLVEKRGKSIIDLTREKIADFDRAGLLSMEASCSLCLNLDYLDALAFVEEASRESHVVVYADPPYFKEHYSRYYHVLNTLCAYDYPCLSINPQTKEMSVGRYRASRNSSDFGKKGKALNAFKLLIKKCSDMGADLVISYSSGSIVEVGDIVEYMEHYFDVKTVAVTLRHSTQGRPSVTRPSVEEYIVVGMEKGRQQTNE